MCRAPACKDSAHVDDGQLFGSLAKSIPGREVNAKVREGPPFDRKELAVVVALTFATVFLIFVALLVVPLLQYEDAGATANVPRPNVFIRLVGVEGLDPHALVPVPPAFLLAVDMDGVSRYYHACSGGTNSMLRLSYHGMILAWGHVPCFCIDGGRLGQSIDGVATVEAKAEGAVLREELRGLIWSERQVLGKAEFDVEGEVAGLGYLRCKAFYSHGKSTDSKASCVVQ